jgi:hypothetical protein
MKRLTMITRSVTERRSQPVASCETHGRLQPRRGTLPADLKRHVSSVRCARARAVEARRVTETQGVPNWRIVCSADDFAVNGIDHRASRLAMTGPAPAMPWGAAVVGPCATARPDPRWNHAARLGGGCAGTPAPPQL